MKVHLRQIPDEGLHLEGETDCPIPELEEEGVRCAGPLQYSLDLGVSEGSLWVNGRLVQKIELACVACLERFLHTIEVPEFVLVTELTGPESVDLKPFMREDILLNVPAYPRCDKHGGRVCKSPQIQTEEPDSEDGKRKADWSALDKLDL